MSSDEDLVLDMVDEKLLLLYTLRELRAISLVGRERKGKLWSLVDGKIRSDGRS